MEKRFPDEELIRNYLLAPSVWVFLPNPSKRWIIDSPGLAHHSPTEWDSFILDGQSPSKLTTSVLKA